MKKDLISVIVPIYKVEQYLEKCVNSILAQTYSNLEIILVDDGSPDNCPQICDNLAKQDKRIKVIHKPNGGLSDARNVGFESSTAKYVTFVDSDDYLNYNFIETLYNNLLNTNADMSIIGYQEVFEDSTVNQSEILQSEVLCFDDSNKFEQLCAKHKLNFIIAWGKLYNRNLFDKIKFPVGKINEDEFIAHHIIDTCHKICFENVPYYYYLQRQNSIMHTTFTERNLHVFEALEDRLAFFNNNPHLHSETLYSYISTIINRYYRFGKPLRKVLLKNFCTLTKQHKHIIKKFNLKRKVKIMLFKYFRIFYKYYNNK